MSMFQCVECLKTSNEKIEKCGRCGSSKLTNEDKHVLTYQNKTYAKKEFEVEVNKLIGLSDNRVYYRMNEFELSRQYLYKYVIKNIKKNTFVRIFLPCIGALVVAFLILIVAVIIKTIPNVLSEEISNALVYFAVASQIAGIAITLYLVQKDFKVIKYFDENEFKYQFLNKEAYKFLMDNLYNEGGYFYFRPLETKRLVVREFNDDDIYDYYEFFKNEKVHKFLFTNAFRNKDEVIEDIDQLISDYKERKTTKLAMVLKDTNHLIGYIGLSKRDYDPKAAQIIYAIGERYWGKGYTPEAVSAFVEWLIKNGKTDIYATRLEENEPSGKVLEKCGFIRNFNKDTDLIDEGIIKHVIGYSYPVGGTKPNEKN